MNEVVERKQKPALVAGGAISAIIPSSIEECFRLAEAIHSSGMAPYGLDTPQKVMIAMMSGLELGMPPMMAVQSIAVINNRPCMWGDALIGVVRNSGVCMFVKEWIEGVGDERIAYCETSRKGEIDPVVRTFSVDDAKRAGLWQTEARVTKTGKGGGTYEKDNDSPWYRYPQRMLQMRARAWCLRDVYPDVLKGMQVREEVEDYQHVGPDNAKDITPRHASNAGQSVIDRLKANKEQSKDGFDAERVNQDLNTAAPPRGGEEETSGDDSSEAEVEETPTASTSVSSAQEGEQVEEEAAVEVGESSASSSPDEKQWLLDVAGMLWAATNFNGDPDLLRGQKKIAMECYEPTGISKPIRDKANSAFDRCMTVVRAEIESEEGLKILAGIVGVEEKVLVERSRKAG